MTRLSYPPTRVSIRRYCSIVPGSTRRWTIVPAGFTTRSTTSQTAGVSGEPATTTAPGLMTVGSAASSRNVHAKRVEVGRSQILQRHRTERRYDVPLDRAAVPAAFGGRDTGRPWWRFVAVQPGEYREDFLDRCEDVCFGPAEGGQPCRGEARLEVAERQATKPGVNAS